MKWDEYCESLESQQKVGTTPLGASKAIVSHEDANNDPPRSETSEQSKDIIGKQNASNDGLPKAKTQSALYAVLRLMQATRKRFHVARFGREDSRPMLTDMMESRRGLGVIDPRDIIYAHLAIANHAQAKNLQVDYSKSVSQVYTDLVKTLISTTRSLWISSHIERSDPSMRRANLPSWVPEWTLPGPGGLRFVDDRIHYGRIYTLYGENGTFCVIAPTHPTGFGVKTISPCF